MAAAGKGGLERARRAVRTAIFMVEMVASFFLVSAPVLVAVGDIAVSLTLASRFAPRIGEGRDGGELWSCCAMPAHLHRYEFKSSLADIPVVSILRSLVITCVYFLFDGPELYRAPYLETTTFCSLASIILLAIKACIYVPPVSDNGPEAPVSLFHQRIPLKRTWGMSVLFLSSAVFALGHIVVAYRATYKSRKKVLHHRMDREAFLGGKRLFSGCYKVSRSPVPYGGRFQSRIDRRKRNGSTEEHAIPINLLTDSDSLFIDCNGISVHYKLCRLDSPVPLSSRDTSFHDSHGNARQSVVSPRRLKAENSQLCDPLLAEYQTLPDSLAIDVPLLSLDGEKAITHSATSQADEMAKSAIVLVHGFGGGAFSWRHIINVLARQVGCAVVAFDRPGWGLTSRLRRKEWEDKHFPNPYRLESQVDLLIHFCSKLGFSYVALVGHDDGGLLALKAAEKIRSSDSFKMEVKGVVLINVSLSREIIPGFARMLLHTPLSKKHLVRPLLRTEITQVVNQRAWYDATKLTADVLNLYKTPLFVDGWDEAVHEIGRLSFASVLSPQNAETLLESMEELPVLVVAGAEDVLVSLKSSQAMASQLSNSRLVAISGCGHLPHEECPKALLSAISPYLTRLLSRGG